VTINVGLGTGGCNGSDPGVSYVSLPVDVEIPLIAGTMEPRNGYTIMQEIEERSNGVWRPSPGSVYPALSQLEDEGLIRSEEQDGRKQFAITEAGREHLAARPADAPAPWDTLLDGVSNEVRDLFGLLRQVAVAAAQLARNASETQVAEGKKVLSEARRGLYRILADGEDGA